MLHRRPIVTLFFVMSFVSISQADHAPANRLDDSALLDPYHTIQLALAKDDLDVAQEAAKALVPVTEKWISEAGAEHPQLANVKIILNGATLVADSTIEEKLRVNFGVLSRGIVEFIRNDAHEPPLKSQWNLYRCPMAEGYQFWVQPKSETKKMNPYMGTAMQQCGSLKPW